MERGSLNGPGFDAGGEFDRSRVWNLFYFPTALLLADRIHVISFRRNVTQQTVEICVSSPATFFRQSAVDADQL